ncbi:MAG: dehydrogenase E1 component subunit alpha/beta [Nitrospirales bacterium]
MIIEKSQQIASHLQAKAILIRSVEQRLLELFKEGRLFGTVHTCIGQEWTGVAVAEALKSEDLIFSNHRCHGHYLAKTGDVEGLIGEIMGKQNGMCGGRGGSQHIYSQGFYSNGIQGGIVPVAAGLAMAQKLSETGFITVVFIGDGTLGEGALYETLNIASIWGLPLLVVLENNYYAQSTSQRQTLAGGILARGEAFGIKTAHANTWNPEELMEVVANCVGYVRNECQPLFLQIDTYRLMAHSKGDDDRDVSEVEEYWAKDPIEIFRKHSDPSKIEEIDSKIQAAIDAAVSRSDDTPYSEMIVVNEEKSHSTVMEWVTTVIPSSERMVNAIHLSLQRNMQRNDKIILIGEDIEGPYGGAFKVTKNLSQEYPGRVRNTPISESALVGLGNGLALNGFLPICEVMFGDFLGLAFDQLLNHASKFQYMYNEQVRVPLVVRTPMGGKRGYGPTHSQSIEKHFMGLPGSRMLALHTRYDPGLVYDEILSSIDCPTIIIENKLLYGLRVTDQVPSGFVLEHSQEKFPDTRIRPLGTPDLTVFCYGGMLVDVERAIQQLCDEHEILCEVICPLQLYPCNPWSVIESVRKTHKLLIVEEGINFAALGSELLAQFTEYAPEILQQVRRVASPSHPIPSCGPLEKQCLPGESHVVETVLEMMDV